MVHNVCAWEIEGRYLGSTSSRHWRSERGSRRWRRKWRRLVMALLLSLTSACGTDGEPTDEGRELSLGSQYRMTLDSSTGVVALLRGGQELAKLSLSSWQLGLVDNLDPGFNYDPYPLFVPNGVYAPPEGLRWVKPVRFDLVARSSKAWDIVLYYPEGSGARLEIEEIASGSFHISWIPPGDLPVAYFRLQVSAPEEQGFYGLGEYFDDVNHRGKLRAMQIEFDPELESRYNEAHVPVPLLVGAKGWGLFVATYYPGIFDVQRGNSELVDVIFGTGEASSLGLQCYLFVAAHGLDVTRLYYEVTGYPRTPPSWVFGPLVWRDENRDQAQFENDLSTMRELDLAATGVWLDRPYASAVNSFDFDPPRFPDPEGMFEHARRLGYRVALWHTPYLDTRSEWTRGLREEAARQGFFPLRTGILLNPWGRPLDFTQGPARAWWQQLLQAYMRLGVAGFKLDYAEDVVVGITSQRNRWLFADGSDERTMHARYQLFYHRTYAEVLPPEGGLLLVRHSTFGGQVFGPVIWPGDLDASFARHREHVSEKGTSYVAVGGLPAAVIAGSGLGVSGFPLFASDTGGYRHSPPDKELFTRWFQHTALSPVMQVGTSSNDVAWEPTPENGFDEEMLEWYRKYTRLHLRMFPYIWTYVSRVRQDGRAVQRPVGLVDPTLGAHPWDEYLLGDDLLIAPVVNRGERERSVLFPQGEWIEWWSGTKYVGPGRARVPAPLHDLPFFLRRGGIVPLLRPTIDTLVPTEEPTLVDSFATTPGLLYVRVFPGGRSAFRVFDGTYISQANETRAGEQLVLELRYEPGADFKFGALFECVGLDGLEVESVRIGGQLVARADATAALETLPQGWRQEGSWVLVRLSPDSPEATLNLRSRSLPAGS